MQKSPARADRVRSAAALDSRGWATHGKLAIGTASVLLAVLLPQLLSAGTTFIAQLIMVQIVFALGTNSLIGHSGISSFGQAAFYGVGAYVAVAAAGLGLPVPLALVASTLAAGVAGALVGWLLIRVKGIAVAMLTLGIAQGIYVLLARSQFMGGDNGINIAVHGWFRPYTATFASSIMVLSLGAILVAWLLFKAPFGLALRAVRDDPLRAAALGINVERYRRNVFIQAACICGFAGGLLAYTVGAVNPKVFYFETSIVVVFVAVIGGLYHFWGPVLGSVIYFVANEIFNHIAPTIWTLFSGVLLLVVVLLAPMGLMSLVKYLPRNRKTVSE